MQRILMYAFLLFYVVMTMFIIIAIQEVAQVHIEGPFWGRIAHQAFVMMTGAGFVWIWQCFDRLRNQELEKRRDEEV